MRYVAAYLLASLGGNDNPKAKDIEAILGSVGIEVDSEKVNKVVSELQGKDINEVIEAGKTKLAGIPTGGSGGGGGAAPAVSGGAADAAPAEEKKEEKKESDSESDDDMGFGLFD